MPIYTIKLIHRKEVARDTLQFDFEKPEGLVYKPGQYGGFTLINPPETDEKGITRRFSLISAPDEPTISIVTRIQTSAFKRVLSTLPLGSEIKFAGPSGKFVLPNHDSRPVVLIAGGIGIAPFYSMIKSHCTLGSPRMITLLYGNETLSSTAYLAELTELAKINSHLNVIPTLSHPPEGWREASGYITPTLINQYVPDRLTPLFYVCGTPAMVTTLQETLLEMQIPEDHIQIEDFPGY